MQRRDSPQVIIVRITSASVHVGAALQRRRASATRRSGWLADSEQAMSSVHPYSSCSFIHARPPSGLPSSHALTASKSAVSAAVTISAGRTILPASARLLNCGAFQVVARVWAARSRQQGRQE